MESNRKILVATAYVIALMFVAGGFATVAFLPANEAPEAQGDLRVSATLPAPLGYWDMSTVKNNKVQNLADPSGATDGTIFNSALSGDGVLGGSRVFDGSSSAIEITDLNNRLKSDYGTVATWVKTTGKPAETKNLRAAIVYLENGENPTQLDECKRLLGLVGDAAEGIYSELVHGHGSLNVSDTIYVQTPINSTVTNHQMVELNNYIAHGNPDIYDYICFFSKGLPLGGNAMMNFKSTIHGIGRPYLWYDELALNTAENYTEPSSKYITAAAVLNSYFPSNDTSSVVTGSARIFVHEMCHAWCAWWNYTLDGELVTPYRYLGCHYTGSYRTDLHSALGGGGWIDTPDGKWTSVTNWYNTATQGNPFNNTEFNLDEYTMGLIPASEVVPTHHLTPEAFNGMWLTPPGFSYTARDSAIPIANITAAMGPWWNEEDRQCIMLRCTNEYGKAFQGQGWGLFAGTVAPNDTIAWWSGPINGTPDWQDWRYGTHHINDGAWHHIAVTWAGSTGTLYVDGERDIQWTVNPVLAAANVHTVIGCEDPVNPYFGTWFAGSIDEVYFFANTLNQGQVRSLAQVPSARFSDNFNDGSISDWTVLRSGTGIVEATSARSHSSPSSLHVYYSGSLNLGRATTGTIDCSFYRDYAIKLWYYASSTNSDKEVVVVDDGRVKIKDYLGTLKASTPGAEVTIGSVSYNVWHEIVISAHPSVQLYGVTIDGVAKGSYAFLSPTEANTLSFGGEVQPGRRSLGEAWWDDISVTGFAYVPPLQVTAAATPTTGAAPLTVSFTATASGGVAPYTYLWAFGDGGTAIARNVSHTYTASANYTPMLIVVDADSNVVQWNTTITVLGAPVTVFMDYFDDGSISDWTILRSGTGVVEATAARSHSPSYSLHVYYSGTSNLGRATTGTITCNFAKDYTISMGFYVSSTNSDKEVVVVDDGRVKIKDYLGTLKASTPGAELTIGTISYNIWHLIVIKAHPSTQTYEVIVDSISKGNFAFLSSSGTNKLSFGGEAAPGRKSLGEAWWDDLRVTGYTS